MLNNNEAGSIAAKDFALPVLLFFVVNLLLIVFTCSHPIGDFGNYYYGSKFFVSGSPALTLYTDQHAFNTFIRACEHGPFFENYAPVPPLSIWFYAPLLLFKCSTAKLMFNILSALYLCWSLYRTLKQLNYLWPWLYALPLLFLQPLYSNYHQGQAYVLVAALLLEFYMAWQRNRKMPMCLIIAVLFCLKIFPAFIAVLFIFKKDWRSLAYIFLCSCVLLIITGLVVGFLTVSYYYMDILPRLAVNEITNPFSSSNQSLYALLLQLFVKHPALNPTPFMQAPWLAVVLQLLFYSWVLMLLWRSFKKAQPGLLFFITVLVLALINRYSTVYGLLMLLPVFLIVKEVPVKTFLALCTVLLLACNLPVHRLQHLPLLLQYLRLGLLFVALLMLLPVLNDKLSVSQILACVLLALIPSLAFLRYNKVETIEEINASRGMLYHFSIEQNSIQLYSCLGNRDTVEQRPFTVNKIDPRLHKVGLQQAMVVNDSLLLYLTDKYRAVGMYALAIDHLKPKQP